MLEEECIVPKATDQTYLAKMHKLHVGKSKSYQKPTPKQTKQGLGDFILHHYAGSVGYSVAGWLEKNKDPINNHTAELFSRAGNTLLSSLFQDYDPDKAGKRKGAAFMTVSARHKEQLKGLMNTLMSTSPHFVRCIIPNENKAPGEIDGQLVLHQLRCNGVLEGIRICRKGFPSRMLFSDFRQRYQILAASAIPAGFVDGKVAVEKLIEALQLDESEFKVGLTKIFFKAGIVGELEEMRDERLSKIISQFQAYCKAHIMRIEFKKMKDRVIGLSVIQRNVRKHLYIRNWPWWKLYLMVQPMLSIARAEDEMKEKEEELKKAMEEAEENAKKRKEFEENLANVTVEKEKLFAELRAESDRLVETEEKLMAMQAEKEKLEQTLNESIDKLEGESHQANIYQDRYKESQEEMKNMTAKNEEAAENINRLEGEKSSLGKQIDSLKEDILRQEEDTAKVNKDKKAVEDSLAERTEQLQATEDKLNKTNKEKTKVENTLKETEFSLEKEKEAKAKVEKEKKKVEADLKDNKDKLLLTEEEVKTTKGIVAKKEKEIKDLLEVQETNENTIKTNHHTEPKQAIQQGTKTSQSKPSQAKSSQARPS
jgi:myosin heavy subunit